MKLTLHIYADTEHYLEGVNTVRDVKEHGIPYRLYDLFHHSDVQKWAETLNHRGNPVVLVVDETGTTLDVWAGHQPEKIKQYRVEEEIDAPD